jgi:Putative transmembrane protein 170
MEAVFAGSVVGLMLGAVYKAGDFKMSTWMPLLWGLLNVSVLILSSFRIQGGL